MTSEVEQGLKAFLDEQALGVPVIAGASATPLPPELQTVLAVCKSVPHVAGPCVAAGGLFDGMVELCVETPQEGELTEAEHAALVALVRGKITDEAIDALSVAMADKAGCAVEGWYLKDSVDEHRDGVWHTAMMYTLALTRV